MPGRACQGATQGHGCSFVPLRENGNAAIRRDSPAMVRRRSVATAIGLIHTTHQRLQHALKGTAGQAWCCREWDVGGQQQCAGQVKRSSAVHGHSRSESKLFIQRPPTQSSYTPYLAPRLLGSWQSNSFHTAQHQCLGCAPFVAWQHTQEQWLQSLQRQLPQRFSPLL